MINGGGRGVGRKRTQRGKPQPRMNWPQENAKVAKKKRHNLFSLSSLRSFAAKNFLELRDFFLPWHGWHGQGIDFGREVSEKKGRQDEQDEQDFGIRAGGHPVNPVKR
jgi:hypothetical protein